MNPTTTTGPQATSANAKSGHADKSETASHSETSSMAKEKLSMAVRGRARKGHRDALAGLRKSQTRHRSDVVFRIGRDCWLEAASLTDHCYTHALTRFKVCALMYFHRILLVPGFCEPGFALLPLRNALKDDPDSR